MTDKLKHLHSIIAHLDSAMIAFSGGVDSSLLLRLCRDILPDRVEAVTLITELQAADEIKAAQDLAAGMGVPHRLLKLPMLDHEFIRRNSPQRCYHCKHFLFSALLDQARRAGLQSVLEGSNRDDLLDYRPGMKALQELNIRSPLLEAGLRKDEVRALARSLNLPVWDRASRPCLATRFPFGQEITAGQLQRVEKAEAFLDSMGLKQFRVRCHGDLARIELAAGESLPAEYMEPAVRYFKGLGFSFVTLDLEEYRQGSMNYSGPAGVRKEDDGG